MADFNISYRITKSNEGGYANDKRDNGGETYKGISRKFHPDWAGWKTIDDYKISMGGKIPTGHVFKDQALDALVVSFYKKKFWDVLAGDQLTNQQIANLLFDFGVNGNHTTVISFVERIINGLGFQIGVDGKIDPIVIGMLNGKNSSDIYKKLKVRIKEYYESLARNEPEKYAWALPGWLNRLKKFPDTLEEIKKKA